MKYALILFMFLCGCDFKANQLSMRYKCEEIAESLNTTGVYERSNGDWFCTLGIKYHDGLPVFFYENELNAITRFILIKDKK